MDTVKDCQAKKLKWKRNVHATDRQNNVDESQKHYVDEGSRRQKRTYMDPFM